jgi:predicted transcriptional regulator
MKLGEIAGYLGLENLTPEVKSIDSLDISAGHSSDLLSDVLANAPGGSVLVTIQVNMSVIAVALHATVTAVIFASGMVPKEEIIERAATEKLPLYSSKESTFDIVGRLYLLGLRGDRR